MMQIVLTYTVKTIQRVADIPDSVFCLLYFSFSILALLSRGTGLVPTLFLDFSMLPCTVNVDTPEHGVHAIAACFRRSLSSKRNQNPDPDIQHIQQYDIITDCMWK